MIIDDAKEWPIGGKFTNCSKFETDWVFQYARSPGVAFDLGSWSGCDALKIKRRFPYCDVHTFEACPQNYSDLMGNPALGGINIHHMAVCDRVGVTEFRSTDVDNCSGSILEPTEKLLTEHKHLNFSPKRLVPCTTVENFCRCRGIPHVDLIHMDVQGAEALVIKGLGPHRPKMIYLETSETQHYHGAGTLSELYALMGSLGYEEKVKLSCDSLFVHKG